MAVYKGNLRSIFFWKEEVMQTMTSTYRIGPNTDLKKCSRKIRNTGIYLPSIFLDQNTIYHTQINKDTHRKLTEVTVVGGTRFHFIKTRLRHGKRAKQRKLRLK